MATRTSFVAVLLASYATFANALLAIQQYKGNPPEVSILMTKEQASFPVDAEVVVEGPNNSSEEDDWTPDNVKARLTKEQARIYAEKLVKDEKGKETAAPASPYTDEEEELIAKLGGKTSQVGSVREPGYLGDCSLAEIATDYSVPLCYLADVLCTWGVPIPINIHDRLGDMVTGEQAFAILEAIHSLDIAQLHDRYSNTNLQNLCSAYDLDLQDAFAMAVKEGWSLPFGVQTCLRVEQEEELLRVLYKPDQYDTQQLDEDDFSSEYQ